MFGKRQDYYVKPEVKGIHGAYGIEKAHKFTGYLCETIDRIDGIGKALDKPWTTGVGTGTIKLVHKGRKITAVFDSRSGEFICLKIQDVR